MDILPYTFLIFFYKTLFQEEKKKKRTMGYSKLKIPLAWLNRSWYKNSEEFRVRNSTKIVVNSYFNFEFE